MLVVQKIHNLQYATHFRRQWRRLVHSNAKYTKDIRGNKNTTGGSYSGVSITYKHHKSGLAFNRSMNMYSYLFHFVPTKSDKHFMRPKFGLLQRTLI